jgi:hypothetical protein
MKSIFLILTLASEAIVCNSYHERPYLGTILCRDGRRDCLTYTLPNGMKIVYESANYDYYSGKGSSFVYCSLINPTGRTLSINREEFVIKSARGIGYILKPFRSEKNPRAMFSKIIESPSVFSVEGGGRTDYTFSYITDKDYPKKEMIGLFKADTIYYLHRRDTSTDTLFSVVAGDSRLAISRR